MVFTLPGFKLTQRLNEGANSEIYHGIRDKDQKRVIIKFLTREHTPENLLQFRREFQIQESLAGIGSVKILSYENTANAVAIVMEDDEMIALKEIIGSKGLPLEKFFQIAISITQILENIHSHHIIHKDLNPYNIILKENPHQVKIIDFGISSILLTEEISMQNLKKLEGMLHYLSPEQTGRMNRIIDYRTDFYSLGITFYEMLTGQLPFLDTDLLELVHSHIAKIPEPVCKINPDIPKVLSDIVDKLISKIPEERYASAAGIQEDLLECQKQWLANKKITPFPLAKKDIRDELIFSQKLYGRENEIDQLLKLFEYVSQGQNVCLFLGGYSGIGKTTLVKEIYRSLTQKSGYFISGKYDQLQRGTPYSALIEAFQGLIHYLLTESEKELNILKEQLLHAIGNSGQVLIDIIPDIALIIGPQPPVPELNPVANQDRFLSTFQNFIHVFAKKEHPLVLFLDDLQWIDTASLHLLENLSTDNEFHYFFFIGAYRENEVDNDHPLMSVRKNIEKNNMHFHEMMLGPLKPRDVHQFMADSFNVKSKEISALTNIILNKTHGNPFFINEFLRKLHQEKMLYFSYKKYKWCWDTAKIEQQDLADNVIDLLIQRIHRLSTDAQELLQYAACIGHIFDLKTLSIVSEKSFYHLSQALTQAIQYSFITPINDNHQYVEMMCADDFELNKKIEYRFQHDRIQQAAYQLIDKSKKEIIHLHIAHLLLKNKVLTENDEQLFEIVDHFNIGLNLLTDKKEKYQLAEYNLWAGKKAKSSTAYPTANKYLETGLSLIVEFPLSIKKHLYFELSKEQAISLYLDDKYELAEDIFTKLIKEATETLSLIEVYKLNCNMLSAQGRHVEAVKLGLKALKELGFNIPLHPGKLRIFNMIIKIAFFFWRHPLNKLEMLPMTNERMKSVMDLISQWAISARLTNERLIALLMCYMIYLSLKYGYNQNTTVAGYTFASILLHKLDNRDKAMRFIDFYTRIEKKYGLTVSKSKIQTILAISIDPWRYPIDKCIESAELAYQYCNEESNYFYAFVINAIMLVEVEMAGKSVSQLREAMNRTINYLKKHKQLNYIYLEDIFNYRHLGYCDPEKAIDFFQKCKELLFEVEYGSPMAVGVCIFLVKDFYIFERYSDANDALRLLVVQRQNFVVDVLSDFYKGLVILANNVKLSHSQKKVLKKIHTFLKRNANMYPENFEFYLKLFEAEHMRFKKNMIAASLYFQEAIQCAEKNKNFFDTGLASQRAAIFYESLGLLDIAKMYYINTHAVFKKWGGVAICKFIENKHPELFVADTSPAQKNLHTTTVDHRASSIDVVSLLQATQAISGEIQLDILLQKLILVLLKNAGAQRGVLMIKENRKDADSWYVAVEGTTVAQHISLKKDIDINERTDLPLSMIRYVQRTQQQVLAQSKHEFEAYKDDPYLKEIKPQSVIVLPLTYQGQFTTILFLENRTTSQAFTPDHIHTIRVLTSQAVISLENARLYYQATHDPLTGLANRNLLYQMFPLAIGRAKRTGTFIGVLFLDLDGFKKINDNLGHEVGDKFLIYFSECLKQCIREGDLAVRLGGDEFIAILEDADHSIIAEVAERILSKKEPVIIQDHAIPVKTSIGISVFPEHGDDIQTLLKQADIALYRVKEAGKGFYQFYTQNLDKAIHVEYQLEKDLENALDRKELLVYYQPIYTANQHTITHFEALIRWQHPKLGLLESKSFIHLIEGHNLIIPIGDWILQSVFKQLQTWQSKNLKVVPVAINISASQLKNGSISKEIANNLKKYNLDSSLIELELTESLFIDFSDKISMEIENLKKLGIKLTLDDFGVHYSSLSYLSRFPFDQMKIDKSFVSNIEQKEKDREIILSIIKLAHDLKISVIGEGIETKYQMVFLEKNGIDGLQGYYLNRPMSADKTAVFLKQLHNVI